MSESVTVVLTEKFRLFCFGTDRADGTDRTDGADEIWERERDGEVEDLTASTIRLPPLHLCEGNRDDDRGVDDIKRSSISLVQSASWSVNIFLSSALTSLSQ